jgi:hypothetical protein
MGSAAFAALERICLAGNLFDEPARSDGLFATDFMANYDRGGSQERLWFEQSRNSHTVWISVHPGETRFSKPEDSKRIVKIPDGSPNPTWNEILDGAIESCRIVRPLDYSETTILRRGLRYRKRTRAFATQGFNKIIADIREAKQEEFARAFSALDACFVEESPCSIIDYAAVLILMHIQVRTGSWMEQDWTEDPILYVKSYLDHIFNDLDLRARSIEVVSAAAREARGVARAAVRKALSGSFAAMSKELRVAAQFHFAAMMMIRALKESAKLARSDLPISPIVAEEGWACTQTGIHMGAKFCLKEPEEEARKFLRMGRGDPDAVAELVGSVSNEIEPTFPKYFAKILIAQGLTLAPRLDQIQRGVTLLKDLRSESLGREAFEIEWIDHAMLNAYQKIEDTTNAEAVATKIAGRLTVRAALSTAEDT